MKFLNPLFLALAVTSVFGHGGNAQPPFSGESQAFKYDIYREIWFDSQVARSADSLHIFFRLDFIKASLPENEPELYYELRDGYDDKSPGDAFMVFTEKNCLYHSLNTYIYYASVSRSQPEDLLVFHVVDKEAGYHYQYDVPLTGENQIPYSDLLLFSAETDAPLVRLFVHEGDSLYLNSLDKGTERAFIYCYRTAFDAADPPMRLIDRSVNKNMVYDTMFTLDIKEPFTLPGNGLYFMQSDTAEIDGISVLCENNHFPKLTTVEDIFEPIIYMSTREELEKIKRSKNKKSAFESYWLKIAKTEEKARKIIRGYYQKIEEANILFTTYKEGWKTDMGMIYIFFGAPDEVYNDGLVEKWYYSKQGSIPAVIFTFEKLRNVFSRQHFILLRKEEYQSLWYNRVDMWRKGLAFQF